MTEQEANDLEILHAKTQEVRNQYYNISVSFSRCKDLFVTGHKGLGSALEYSLKDAQKKIEKLTQEHLKKYPD